MAKHQQKPPVSQIRNTWNTKAHLFKVFFVFAEHLMKISRTARLTYGTTSLPTITSVNTIRSELAIYRFSCGKSASCALRPDLMLSDLIAVKWINVNCNYCCDDDNIAVKRYI